MNSMPKLHGGHYFAAFALACLPAIAPSVHAQTVTYADVAPIFAQKCVLCHSGAAPTAGLGLDSLESVLTGSTRGPVVKSGAPADSELVRRIKGISQPRMPITGPPFLSDSEIATIERWIAGGLEAGAPVPTLSPAAMAAPRPQPGETVTYAHVAPIFARHCAKCHTDNGLMGPAPEGLRLTSYETILSTFDRARVVPGHPEASELVRRIRGQANPRMPFDGPPWLDLDDARLIEDWIAQGARSAEGVVAAVPAGAVVRLHGTLGAGGRLDGLELVLGARTRIDKNPAPGSYVEVRGRLDERARVVVERLRSR